MREERIEAKAEIVASLYSCADADVQKEFEGFEAV